MEVLNVIEDSLSVGKIIASLFFLVLAILALWTAIWSFKQKSYFASLILLLMCAVYAYGCFLIIQDQPDKYEVILREGESIDATKYKIIEHRGKIYVIQERK